MRACFVRCFALLLAVWVVPALLPTLARAQEADPPAYRGTIDDAVSEFSAGRYEEARALFKRAHELSPNARTLRGLGMTAYELRMYVQGLRELEAALRETRKPLDATMRASVEALAVKARAFVGRVTPQLEPKDAKLLVDGKPPVFEPDGAILLDAGTHSLSATADKHKPTSVRIAIEGGSDQLLRLPLEPLPQLDGLVPAIDPTAPPAQPAAAEPPATPAPAPAQRSRGSSSGSTVRTIAWITLAGTVAFGATSAAFWAVGSSQYDEVEDKCAPTCSEAAIDDSGVGTSDLLTTVFLGAAVAGGAATAILFVVAAGQDGDDAEPGPSARLELGPLGVRVRGTL